MLPPAQIDGIVALLDAGPGVDNLWVFGSEATGRTTEDSDLDLAALFRRRPTSAEIVELSGKLTDLVGRPVDLVDLDRASPIVGMQAMRHGTLVVDRSPRHRFEYLARLPGLYEDLARVRAPIERALLRRMSRG